MSTSPAEYFSPELVLNDFEYLASLDISATYLYINAFFRS
jgi:hypothetical protein